MRLFKVYSADESDNELVFARSHRQAASIARAVWHEHGFRCRHFKVVELQLPAKMETNPVGLIYEPATMQKDVRL